MSKRSHLALCLLAACSSPKVEDIAVRPCRITGKSKTVAFQYDERGRMVRREDRSAVSDSVSTWTFVYEGDRIREHVLTSASSSLTFFHERDADGHHIETFTRDRKTGDKRPDWRGVYKDGRLVRSFGAAGSMANTTDYAYDSHGRLAREISHYRIAGTSVRSYVYGDDMDCKRYGEPLVLPNELPQPACPTVMRIEESGRRTETQFQYRDGRLVDDGDRTYVYDAAGRIARTNGLRVPGDIDTYEYDCP